MVTILSASSNPVIFKYSDVVLHHQLDFSVGWDTGEPAVKARVFRSLDGGAETPLPGAAQRIGTVNDRIALDQVLGFVLRRAGNNNELARTTVTTQKNALAAYMTDPDLDFIFSLKVNPGVDSIGLSFSTRQPAIPWVELRRHDNGELVAHWMGQGFRQQHANVFDGYGAGLAQETLFDMRIVAMKDVGGGRVQIGSGAHNPERRGSVSTGARSVTFEFDLILVRNDGDPAGAGEFTFAFGVGDELTRKRLGPSQIWKGDVSDGEDRDVNKRFRLEHAPRRLWAQVNAYEDDASVFNPLTPGFGMPGIGPAYYGPGTNGFETDYGSFASVTGLFDTDATSSGRQRGFKMSTGNFSIAFDVFGSMTVVRRPGTNHFKGLSLGKVKTHKFADSRQFSSRVLELGQMQMFRNARAFVTVGMGPDGAVVVSTADPLDKTGAVIELGGSFDGPVTLVVTPQDTLYLFGLTSAGAVVVQSVSPESGAEGGWTDLGGEFAEALTAIHRGKGVDVLARDVEGRIYHRMYTRGDQDGHWTRIGDNVTSPVAAAQGPTGDLAVFALGMRGQLRHKRLTADGEWLPGASEWKLLADIDECTATAGTIRVHWGSDKDLIVSVFTDDELDGALLWRDYPASDPDADWISRMTTGSSA